METLTIGSREDIGEATYLSMGRLRYDTFVKECGWELPLADHARQLEFDEFDSRQSLYVLASTADSLVGCARLTPTLQPNLTQDVFGHLLPHEATLRRADVWEISRLCVSRSAMGNRWPRVFRELFSGALAFGGSRGAQRFIGVVSVPMERLYRRHGFALDRIGAVGSAEQIEVTICSIDAITTRASARPGVVSGNGSLHARRQAVTAEASTL